MLRRRLSKVGGLRASVPGGLRLGNAIYRSGFNGVDFSTHYYLPALREIYKHHEQTSIGRSITGS